MRLFLSGRLIVRTMYPLICGYFFFYSPFLLLAAGAVKVSQSGGLTTTTTSPVRSPLRGEKKNPKKA
jgi:alkanesulfonate monooxygenase SsuD/methylene tetrahydromethanopterin reductase-like flavin-dependent oxidoreductase (luciferase family)